MSFSLNGDCLQNVVRNLPPDIQKVIFQYDSNESPLESFLIVHFPFVFGQSQTADKAFGIVLGHRNIVELAIKEYSYSNHRIAKLLKLNHLTIFGQSANGNLATVHYLFSFVGQIFDDSTLAIDLASRNGYLEIVQFLHSLGKDCTTNAMDWASASGHLSVVQYLHSIGKECTENAMDWASKNGHLEMVQYLHSIGKNCTAYAMDWASANGHLKVVQYLHSIRKASTPYALVEAIRNSHFEVVQYLADEIKNGRLGEFDLKCKLMREKWFD